MSLWTVFIKEVIDNLRDRQTLLYALLVGPVLLPLMIGGSLAATARQFSIDFDEQRELAVWHAERAPQLMDYLASNNINAVDAAADALDQVASRDLDILLEIDADFVTALRDARPAPLTLHLNESNKDSQREANRIRLVLGQWAQQLAGLRLQHRGMDPSFLAAIEIEEIDHSQDGAQGQVIASLLPFLLIMSMVIGGFYLAIDTTAGERERRSLEPLLTLPLHRHDLVFGKFLATMLFITVSAMLTTLVLFLLYHFNPDALLGSRVRFDALTMSKALLSVLPLAAFIGAMLISVSAFTRSTKQAQSWLGMLMVIPTAPYFILQFVNLKSAHATMFIPMLSNYQLLERAALQQSLPVEYLGLSVAGNLLGAALMLWVACRLYARERLVTG